MATLLSPIVSTFTIKIDGNVIPANLSDALTDVEVHNDLHLPKVAIIKFNQHSVGNRMTDIPDKVINDYMKDGSTVEIQTSGGLKKGTIFKGEVTSIGIDYSFTDDAGSMIATVHAYDKAHRLHRGKNTKTFLNSKYADVVKKIAGNHGLSPSIDQTTEVHDYILQSNQTDWEFLWQMANRIGYEVFVDDTKLYFKKIAEGTGAAIDLQYGESLATFRVRASTAFQPAKAIVRGWDIVQKQAIHGEAVKGSGESEIGASGTGAKQAEVFGDSQVEVINAPVNSQAEADAMAKSLMASTVGDHVYAEGTLVQGNADMEPRKFIDVTGVGTRFKGKYYVTAVTHRYTGFRGYETSFVVGERRSDSLLELVDSGPGGIPPAKRMNGVATAVVTNVEDPDNMGRVKVMLPWLNDGSAEVETFWARIATPGAGINRGIMFLPEVDDEVLVSFEHGDVMRPYIVGGLWNGKDKPPLPNEDATSGGTVNQRIIKSRSGHVIILDDTDGEEQIIIKDKTEANEIVIAAAENTLSIKMNGNITIESGGEVKVISAQDLTLEGKANINIKSTQDCTIEATGNLNLKGLQLSAEGTAGAELKSPNTSVSGDGMTEIKGGIVRIN